MSPDQSLVVFEKLPFWGPELKRQFRDRTTSIRECRAVRDIDATELSVTTIVVIDVPAAPADCLAWLTSRRTGPPTIAILSRELAQLEWSLRESGIDVVVDDEVPGATLRQWCLRLWRRAALSGARDRA